MQYLLTKEELDALEPKAGADKLRADYAAVSKLVAKLTRGRCIHDPNDGTGGPVDYFGYCDDCGMGNLDDRNAPRCPFPRNFSK